MKTAIERPVITCGKDENIMSMVVFPCNEEDLKERFQVSDLVKELKFVDVPESKVSIPRFNGLVLDSPSRGAKLEEQINAAVRYLEERLLENPQWRGKSEEIPLNFADSMVWNWCMKDDYVTRTRKSRCGIIAVRSRYFTVSRKRAAAEAVAGRKAAAVRSNAAGGRFA